MCPQPVVACCDPEACHEVIGNGPDGRLELKRCPKSLNTAVHGNADDEVDVQPVDMLIPVRLGDWGVGDVRLFRIIFVVSIWL